MGRTYSGGKNKNNLTFWENRLEQEKQRKQRRKTQRDMTAFFSVLKKSSDEEGEKIDGSADD